MEHISEIKSFIHQNCFNKIGEFKSSLKRNVLDIVLRETVFLPLSAPLRERLYCLLNGLVSQPLCKICHKSVKFDLKKYRVYCSLKCSNNDEDVKQKTKAVWKNKPPQEIENIVRKRKQTSVKRCGKEHDSQTEEGKLKRKQTNLKNHGVEHPIQSTIIKENHKQTMLKNHGVTHNWLIPGAHDRKKETWTKNHGVDNPLKSQEIRQKAKQTNLKNLGVESPLQNKQIQQQTKQTNLKRHGVEWILSSTAARNKGRQRLIREHGVVHPTQIHFSQFCKDKMFDYEWLLYQHHENKRPIKDIALELQIDPTTVSAHMKKLDISVNRFPFSRFSKKSATWLESLMRDQNIFIQCACNIGEYRICNTRFFADGYCEETNTIYEFYGNVWHGNPNLFDLNDCVHPFLDITVGELYENTLQREKIIRELGYNLITIWESEWDELQRAQPILI